MGKSACPVDKKKRLEFLRDNGFELLRNGKGSHQIWAHKESGEVITLCSNPAKGTWLANEKQILQIAQKHEAKIEAQQAQAQNSQKAKKSGLFADFKKVAKKQYLMAKEVGFTFDEFRKNPKHYKTAIYK